MEPDPVEPIAQKRQTTPFKFYALFVRDTAQLSDRRQALNAIYISVNSVVLGAVAILAQVGGLSSPVFLAVEVFVAFAGFLIAGQWKRMIKMYQALLRFRFTVLIEMEKTLAVPCNVKMYSEEKRARLYGFSELELQLPVIFQLLYSVGSILLVLISLSIRLGWFDALRTFLLNYAKPVSTLLFG